MLLRLNKPELIDRLEIWKDRLTQNDDDSIKIKINSAKNLFILVAHGWIYKYNNKLQKIGYFPVPSYFLPFNQFNLQSDDMIE